MILIQVIINGGVDDLIYFWDQNLWVWYCWGTLFFFSTTGLIQTYHSPSWLYCELCPKQPSVSAELCVKETTTATHPAAGILIHSEDMAIDPALFDKRWGTRKIVMQAVAASLSLTTSSHQQVCCSLHMPHCGLSGLQWKTETKANWLTDDLILVGSCMPSFQGIRPWACGTPICPGCISWWRFSYGTELKSSSHALHHLADHQLSGLGLGTMCWM